MKNPMRIAVKIVGELVCANSVFLLFGTSVVSVVPGSTAEELLPVVHVGAWFGLFIGIGIMIWSKRACGD